MRRRYPSRRLPTTLMAAVATGLLQVAIPMTAAAILPPIDFGTVGVGNSASLDYELPLDYALSEIPADTVLYSGGDPTIDFALSTIGLTTPLTAGALYGAIGEITATYHLDLSLVVGTQFSLSAPTCATGTVSCTVTVTFAPTAEGSFTDAAHAQITDLDVSGSSTYATLIDFMAPFVAPQVEEQLVVDLAGAGSTATSGLELRVSVAPEAAPCVLLDTGSIDFGTLPFSTEAALSEGSAGVTVSSCSTGSQAIYVNGTDANGSGGAPASWALSAAGGNPCSIGVNQYGVSLDAGGSGMAPMQLSTVSSSWIVIDAAIAVSTTVDYQMPCVGSDGAGQTMSSQVSILATVP